jgi:hypothetical protein
MSSFDPIEIPQVPVFADLRATLLQHDDPKRRWPRWQFLFARDLAIQIRPQAEATRNHTILFDCRALEGQDIRREHFRSHRASTDAGLARLDFIILVRPDAPDVWLLKVFAAGVGRRLNSFREATAVYDALRQRVLGALRPNEIGEVDAQMLSHCCLICGRALTDPISMARLIGPECAEDYNIPAVRQIAVAAPAMPGSAQPDLFAVAK